MTFLFCSQLIIDVCKVILVCYFLFQTLMVLLLWLAREVLPHPAGPPPVNQPQISLSPKEQEMLEALVDEAIAQEELARVRREQAAAAVASDSSTDLKTLNKRFSSPPQETHEVDVYGPPPTDVSSYTVVKFLT